MFVYYQPNPQNKKTDDCVIRALTKALDCDWDTASIYAIIQQIRDSDLFVKNYVWGNLLLRNGYTKHSLPNTCPDCYTIKDFATLPYIHSIHSKFMGAGHISSVPEITSFPSLTATITIRLIRAI